MPCQCGNLQDGRVQTTKAAILSLVPTSETLAAQATRDRSAVKTAGGKIIRVEAHPIPEHPRPKRVQGRAGLVGDAAGYVTKCSGAWMRSSS